MDLDLDLPNFNNDDPLLPLDAEPFPAMAPGAAARARRSGSSSTAPREEESSESAGAPLQRKMRVAKQLPIDERQELHNVQLEEWKNNYVANMAAAVSSKAAQKAAAIAKKNAAYWVMGFGIGGVGVGVGNAKIKGPLDVFSGPAFMDALTGAKRANIGIKRARRIESEDKDGSDSDARRVRAREDDGEQYGRGNDNILQDDDTGMTLASEVSHPTQPFNHSLTSSQGIEVGRHAQTHLEDPSMPWNISASSHQGSLARGRGFQSSIGGFSTSVGDPGSLPGMGGPHPGSLDRRASRITSTSPLVGRGQHRYSSLELPVHGDDPIHPGDDRPISDPQALEDFELYGPGAAVNTQTAVDSQWVKAALTREASNFLEFVRAEIIARAPLVEQDEDELSSEAKTSVTFEELLPPGQHSKLVGAQGFHHVLTLATVGKLDVKQIIESETEGFGPIELAVTAGAGRRDL